MAKSNAKDIKDLIAKLTNEDKMKLFGKAPAGDAAGKDWTDEKLQAELIEKAYDARSESLSFDEWVKMKLPTLVR